MLNERQINLLINGVREASAILMSHYRNPRLRIQSKEDLSPVTEADLASNSHLTRLLSQEFPDIPIISEESYHPAWSIRKKWDRFWMLDPLDGTREFIAANGEFAVNLALIRENRPVFGIISIPAKELVYYGILGGGSWKLEPGKEPVQLPLQQLNHQETGKMTALISRSHSGEKEKEFLKRLADQGWQVEVRPTGSSYKHVLLAEGSAHLYAKPGVCWEWDTAPGQIILEEAGGSVVRMDDGQPLVYNKEVFSNPDLVMWAPGAFIPL